MEVSLKPIDSGSRHVLENLFTYYVYDMSEFIGLDPSSNGLYEFKPKNLNDYWSDSNHIPYFIYVDGLLAGFVLIQKYPTNLELFDIDQFFVLRKFKGNGVGKKAFGKVLNNHPGKWQVRVLKENTIALSFWLSAVRKAVGANFQHMLDIDVDLEMHFIHFSNAS